MSFGSGIGIFQSNSLIGSPSDFESRNALRDIIAPWLVRRVANDAEYAARTLRPCGWADNSIAIHPNDPHIGCDLEEDPFCPFPAECTVYRYPNRLVWWELLISNCKSIFELFLEPVQAVWVFGKALEGVSGNVFHAT